MTRILLAYSHFNTDLATSLAEQLGRIGIPFDHITNLPDDAPGAFAARLHQTEEPVLLLVTDNLLRHSACMSGLLDTAQHLATHRLLLPVIADGKNADGSPVPTHIDRMVNALHYMNHWQNAWLDLSGQHQNAATGDKAALEQPLDINRTIANQVGDLISTLREAGAVEWPQFQHNGYAAFFQKFGLQDWHEQYKNLQAATAKPAPPTLDNQAVALAPPPIVSGPLAPLPAEPDAIFVEMDALLSTDLPVEISSTPSVDPSTLLTEEPEKDLTSHSSLLTLLPDNLLSEPTPLPESDVSAMIHDAWFWINQGHTERGLELFELAIQQYPDHTELRQQYEKAKDKEQEAQGEEHGINNPKPETRNPKPETTSNEAKSYDLMGDMAAEKGDYLFAKYCWDRSAELDPTFPNIFHKLGLITYEHLRDYKETALVYLHKALEINPKDAEVLLALADNDYQLGDRDNAARRYTEAVGIAPALRTAEHDRLFLQIAESDGTSGGQRDTDGSLQDDKRDVERGISSQDDQEAQPSIVHRPPSTVLTVLITGATSGIGRATAEVFAQHGHRLILTGRRTERLSAMNRELEEKYGTDTLMLPFDVRDQRTAQHIFDSLPESWQNIDILLNNAGLAKGLAPIHEGELEHWETMIDTNIKGLLYVTRAIAPGMVRRRRGHIINISSSAGKEVYANGGVYCATKFAVEALTRAMRLDLHQHNIRVSQVSPGHVEETEFAITRFDGDAERAKIYNDFQPLKASDVADAIYFIATRPAHVNIQDIWMFGTQQASATVINRSGR